LFSIRLRTGRVRKKSIFQYPHLSLAQIYAAFAYYHDHQNELDAQIEQSVETYERLKAEAGDSPLQKRLRDLGKLR
jgi:hypothetical protein